MGVKDIREVRLGSDPKEVLQTLDSIRNRIIAGEATGVVAAFEQKDGTYTVVCSGCEDSRKFAGTLMELAIRRIGFEYVEQ